MMRENLPRVSFLLLFIPLSVVSCFNTNFPGDFGDALEADVETETSIVPVREPLLCGGHNDCPFSFSCVAGVCEPGVEHHETEGCFDDDDCPSGQVCASSTGLCVPESESPQVTNVTDAPCFEGETRKCGSKVGRCEYGFQTCTNLEWAGECEGGIGPIAEECNGIDDDCDGIVPGTEVDADSDGFRVCGGDCDDNDPLVNPDALEVCDGVDNNCVEGIDENPLVLCDDGLFCNGVEICSSGVCVSTAVPDCSGLTGGCQVGVCDELNDVCAPKNAVDGTVCDDGDRCSTQSLCADGTCEGLNFLDCSSLDDVCNTGSCIPEAGVCYPKPRANGTTCNDGTFCTSVDQCMAGACVGSGVTDCSGVTGGDSCYDGVCDSSADQCVAVDNATCDPCIHGSPVAVVQAVDEVVPDTIIEVDGSASYDPDGQPLTYAWWVEEQPSGSTATLQDAFSPRARILGDVSGDFKLCLSLNDTEACQSNTECVTIRVKPKVALHFELTWDTDLSDLDLHYLAPGGTYFDKLWDSTAPTDLEGESTDLEGESTDLEGESTDLEGESTDLEGASTDTYFWMKRPDWGLNGTGLPDGNADNDPRLDVDNVDGFGPENINQDSLFEGNVLEGNGRFVVAINFWQDKGYSYDCRFFGLFDFDFDCTETYFPATARLRIYKDGELEKTYFRELIFDDLWEVAEIEVIDGGSDVIIHDRNTLLYEPSGHHL